MTYAADRRAPREREEMTDRHDRWHPAVAVGALACALGVAVAAAAHVHAEQPRPYQRLPILATEKPRYSQGYEEVIIRDYFQDKTGGFFVDVGSAHYKDLSTTYYLEKHLGWSGIGIDALAEYGAEYEVQRPRTEFVNAAVTDRSGDTISFFRADAWRELSSVDKSVAEGQGKLYRDDGSTTEVRVGTVTLDDLLDARGVKSIDFLSMDIEESEPAALRGFDIRRFRPKLVCIEAHEAVRPFLAKYFADHGYRRIDLYGRWDDLNWYFMPADLPESPTPDDLK